MSLIGLYLQHEKSIIDNYSIINLFALLSCHSPSHLWNCERFQNIPILEAFPNIKQPSWWLSNVCNLVQTAKSARPLHPMLFLPSIFILTYKISMIVEYNTAYTPSQNRKLCVISITIWITMSLPTDIKHATDGPVRYNPITILLPRLFGWMTLTDRDHI